MMGLRSRTFILSDSGESLLSEVLNALGYYSRFFWFSSDNTIATADTVENVLTVIPNLRRLVLLGNNIPGDDILNLLERKPELFYRLEALIHPCFFHLEEDGHRNVLSHLGVSSRASLTCSLPYFTPAQVVQALIDYLPLLCKPTFIRDSFMGTKSVISPHSVYASMLRKNGEAWNE